MQEKWEIIFLIYADFREGEGVFFDTKLVRELTNLFQDIANAKLNDTHNVFIIMNGIRYRIERGTALTNDKTFIYEVEKREGQRNKLKHFTSEILNAIPLQQEASLGKIFEAIHDYSRADRTLLITWDHGSAFGIFKTENNPDQITLDRFKPLDEFQSRFATLDDFAALFLTDHERVKGRSKKALFEQEICKKPIYRYKNVRFYFTDVPSSDKEFYDNIQQMFSQEDNIPGHTPKDQLKLHLYNKNKKLELISNNPVSDFNKFNKYLKKGTIENIEQENTPSSSISIETTDTLFEMLTNEELAHAIDTGFGKPVDVLVMMNCYMMNLHACYAFKGSVQYFIAPQSGIDEPGYDYKSIIESLTQPNTVLPEEVARECLLSTFDPARTNIHAAIKEWAIFCINLESQHVMSLADKIDDLARYLNDHINDLKARIRDTRQICFRFDDSKNLTYNMIDLTHFLKLFDKDLAQFSSLSVHGLKIKKFLNDILSLKEAIKIEEQEILGKIYEVAWVGSTITEFEATGLSIYYPLQLDIESPIYKYFMAENSPFPSNLLKEKENWLHFLKKIAS